MRRAYHYVASLKGKARVRFYHESGRIGDSAARAFGVWCDAPIMLWPTSAPGVYRATWFDKISDTYRESEFRIIEELDQSHPSSSH